MSDTYSRSRTKQGKLVVKSNRTLGEDIRAIGRGLTGYKGSTDASGIGGRRREAVIDAAVADTSKKRPRGY